MSKAEKTKQYIIEKTASLFNTKGYISTSLSDITEATGLTKGSIYGNFENKDDLALEVYRFNAGILSKSLSKSFGEEFPSALEKLNAFVDFYRKNWRSVFENGGCPLMNAATEADDMLPDLKKQVRKSFDNWIRKISETIETGKKNGEFNAETDAVKYASLFIMLIEGGILLSKITENEKHLNLALDHVSEIINKEIKKNIS